MKYLHTKFGTNGAAKQSYKQRVKNAVDIAFLRKQNLTLNLFKEVMLKEQISITFRQSKEGFLYSITYIDLKNKSVFNGSDLGKEYSAKGITDRCSSSLKQRPQGDPNDITLNQNPDILMNSLATVFEDLIKPETTQNNGETFQLKKFKKKRKLRQ